MYKLSTPRSYAHRRFAFHRLLHQAEAVLQISRRERREEFSIVFGQNVSI